MENRRHLLHHFPRPGQRGFCQGGRRSSPAHRALLGALPPLRGITLAFLGADGAGCPVQLYAWKSLYNLTLGQGALLIALGGYLGTLFLGLLSMWVSAKSGSTVLAAVLPFAVIFLPALMLGDINTLLSNILGLLPDKLLQINRDLAYFDLYQLGTLSWGPFPFCWSFIPC